MVSSTSDIISLKCPVKEERVLFYNEKKETRIVSVILPLNQGSIQAMLLVNLNKTNYQNP